ncbi:nickel/cobalt transporter [Streptomyces sp. NBC_01766]|uniref:nickel/cobalt transporter n=1 Tax=Streptomyces sp. NBC_01766 TaxID=2975936 RepID=UPI002DDA3C94|nr:high frequency lysogenization protein HflD [Streptomyces sp. NBC_01766]WSC20758.1 high frequency lysogenization protein HflD [Streptomyces sp. NBC_01766]
MTHRPHVRRAVAVAVGALWLLGAAVPPAQAHPLGNFSVNHYTGFTLRPDRVDVTAVTDTAEIPTLQDALKVDSNGDGKQSDAERAHWAAAGCARTAGKLEVTAPRRLKWTVRSARFDYRPGQGGLRTSRLECDLRAPLRLTDGPVSLRVDTGADRTRVGWNEITAKGEGTHLQHSTVPESSVTDELRNYPRDLLSTPRGDTTAQFTAAPGEGAAGTHRTPDRVTAGSGPAARVEAVSRQLMSLAGAKHLTLPIGILAVLLSVVLGAGHALLPGHGKTVMAAYLAGKRGRTRDAVTVGATVTLTHTAGVIVIGLCLTVFSSLAGDAVLGWLGVVSGALVALVGAGLLRDAVRQRRRAVRLASPDGLQARAPEPELVGAGSAVHHEHTHDPGHEHAPHHEHEPHHDHDHTHDHAHTHEKPHRHGLFGHHHTHAPATADPQPFSTRGLIGLGIAGGLVPSPSALVVLLGAIALGRTAFGAALVLAYGLGMAATLTAVGLVLVRIGGRVTKLSEHPLLALVRRVAPHTAVLTAFLVLVVGLGLMIRSLPPVL